MSKDVKLNTTPSEITKQGDAWILNDLYSEFQETLAADRGTDQGSVADWLETSQFNATEARAAGIVDRALFWEELESRLDVLVVFH